MTTQLFLRAVASDLGGAGQFSLATTRGAASTTAVTNTAASGTNIQVTKTAAGQVLTWFSAPIAGTPTVSGTITVNVRGLENSTLANACAGITIERTNGTGTVQSTIVANTTVTGTEYTTSDAASNASKTPTSTTFTSGDRIKVTLFSKNVGTMASGHTTTNTYDGPTSAAAGDTFITLTETLSFVVNANVTGVGASVTAAGGVGTPVGGGPFTPVGSAYTTTSTGSPASSTTMALTNQNIGDLILVFVRSTTTTATPTSISGGGATWVQVGTTFTGTTNAESQAIFAGTVTATGAQTATISLTGGTANIRADGQEFTSSTGSWAFDVQGNLDSAGTNTWPSLTPAAAGELYAGMVQNAAATGAVTTPGYVSFSDINSNAFAYNPNCGAGAQAPVFADSGQTFGTAVLMTSAGGSTPANVTGVAASVTAAGGAGTFAGSASATGVAAAVTAAGAAGTVSASVKVTGTAAAVTSAGGAGTAASSANLAGTGAAVTVAGGAGTAAGSSPNANVTGVAAAVAVAAGTGTPAGSGAVTGVAAPVPVAGGAGTFSGTGHVTGVTAPVTVAGGAGAPSGAGAVTGTGAAVTVAGGTGTPASAVSITGTGAQVTVAGGIGTPAGTGGGAANVSGVAAAVTITGGGGTPSGSAAAAGQAAVVTVAGAAGTASGSGKVTGSPAVVTVAGVAGTAAGTGGGGARLDAELLSGIVTQPLWSGTVTLPPWSGIVTPPTWGGVVAPSPWGGTAAPAGGIVGTQSDLAVIVGDDELIGFQILFAGAPLNLTGYTLALYLKANRNQPNAQALATYGIGTGITITNIALGQFNLDIPKAQLPIPAAQWYRCDVIDGSGNVATALFGNVTVQAV